MIEVVPEVAMREYDAVEVLGLHDLHGPRYLLLLVELVCVYEKDVFVLDLVEIRIPLVGLVLPSARDQLDLLALGMLLLHPLDYFDRIVPAVAVRGRCVHVLLDRTLYNYELVYPWEREMIQ